VPSEEPDTVIGRIREGIRRLFDAPVADWDCQRCGKTSNSVAIYLGRPTWVLCKECNDDSPPARLQDYYPPYEYWDNVKNE